MKVLRDDAVVFAMAKEARTYFERLVGLCGRKSIDDDEALLFRKCDRIHCHFMKVTIDVVYLDERDRVLFVETVPPWKMGAKVPGCTSVLECGEGVAVQKGIEKGDKLGFMD